MSNNSNVFTPGVVDKLVKETLPFDYIYWDANGSGLGCSPNVPKFFGLNTSQEVFDNWDRLSPPTQPNGCDSSVYFKEILSLAHTHGKAVADWQHQTIGGKPVSVEVTCVRHSINGTDVFMSYLRDHKKPQTTVPTARVDDFRFISILRTCPICFAILAEERFTFVTPFMCNFLGTKVGDSLSSFIADPAMVELLCKEPQGSDFISWTPVTIRTRYDITKEMLAYSLWFDNPGGAEQIIWLVDITQSKKLENELRVAKNIAEVNMNTKSAFLANMSHEIRTPMNAIIGLTHLVLRSALSEQQKKYIETVQQSARILLRLINDILDFSKIEAGHMVLEYQAFAIKSIITEISAVVDVLLKTKGLELQIDIDANLSPNVMGDSVRLHQVILNLLTNAIKFTEKGAILLKIEVVEADVLSTIVRFSVTDTGIGMTPIQVKGLFQPFSQASASTSRKFGGTGLGLAISKRIVELMHGDISCQSKEGKGTTFVFTVRFGIPQEGEVTNVDESIAVYANALLVGDCPQDLSTMRHYIELLGLKVYQVGVELSDFEEFLHSESMKTIGFVIFDFSDLRKDFVPIYTAMGKKHLDPSPLCVVTENPELESILDELGVKDSVISIGKPVMASDLFNVVPKTTSRREELLRQKTAQSGLDSTYGKDDVFIPDSVRGAKILLAEDNKINQMVAREMLKAEGFETTVADNGRIAIELLKKQKFDIVLMDVQMPEIDGLEATRMIRADEQFKDIPILAMTANAMPGDHEISIGAGMNDHIAKPIDPKILYRALVKWIQK